MASTKRPLNRHWNFVRHHPVMAVLALCLLLLTGCGFFGSSRNRSPEEPTVTHPPAPVRPAVFADFDERTYIPDRVVIPAISLDTPVVDLGWSAATDPSGRVFSRWDVAAFAAGWHVNSAQLGQAGNVVMSGHNNILGAVFRELDQLQAGDVATIWSGNTRYNYAIDKVVIVPDRHATEEQRRDNAGWISQFGDDRLTLVSCWPRDDNSHRIIVVGHYVGNGIDGVGAEGSTSSTTRQ